LQQLFCIDENVVPLERAIDVVKQCDNAVIWQMHTVHGMPLSVVVAASPGV
jgi:hypothetical protein